MTQSKRSKTRTRTIWIGGAIVAVVLLVIVGALAYWFVAGPGRQGGPPGSVILQMSGDRDDLSKEFYARPGWSIQWENTGTHFSYTIRGDVDFGQVINQNGPGNGITSPVPTGNFRIQVAAEGPWSITVIQGD